MARILSTILLLILCPMAVPAQQIAFTFDDLPAHGPPLPAKRVSM